METQQKITDVVSGTVTYVGYADPGTATSEPRWHIEKHIIAGGVTTIYFPCDEVKAPSPGQKFVWDDRASLTFSLTPDKTLPTLSTVTIASDNTDTTKAKIGDTVTLTIVASEGIETPVVTIAGHSATVTKGASIKEYTAEYVMASGDTEGTVTFNIQFTDMSGNAGNAVSTITGGSNVIFDKTAPTMSSAVRTTDTSLELTLSEGADEATTTKSNDGGFVVHETGTPATTYAVSEIAPGGTSNKVVLTIADASASALAGLTIKYAHSGNGTVADPTGNAMATNATGITIAAWGS